MATTTKKRKKRRRRRRVRIEPRFYLFLAIVIVLIAAIIVLVSLLLKSDGQEAAEAPQADKPGIFEHIFATPTPEPDSAAMEGWN